MLDSSWARKSSIRRRYARVRATLWRRGNPSRFIGKNDGVSLWITHLEEQPRARSLHLGASKLQLTLRASHRLNSQNEDRGAHALRGPRCSWIAPVEPQGEAPRTEAHLDDLPIGDIDTHGPTTEDLLVPGERLGPAAYGKADGHGSGSERGAREPSGHVDWSDLPQKERKIKPSSEPYGRQHGPKAAPRAPSRRHEPTRVVSASKDTSPRIIAHGSAIEEPARKAEAQAFASNSWMRSS
jgi:hypothetical protein